MRIWISVAKSQVGRSHLAIADENEVGEARVFPIVVPVEDLILQRQGTQAVLFYRPHPHSQQRFDSNLEKKNTAPIDSWNSTLWRPRGCSDVHEFISQDVPKIHNSAPPPPAEISPTPSLTEIDSEGQVRGVTSIDE